MSFGFWPGGEVVEDAAFYAYAAPEPTGFRDANPHPAAPSVGVMPIRSVAPPICAKALRTALFRLAFMIPRATPSSITIPDMVASIR